MSCQTKKRSRFLYGLWRLVANAFASLVFKRKFIRNEIKGKKGPFVVIANHQAALDFVNLMGATKEQMNFVISSAFFRTLPMKSVVSRLGFIPKQQFQTSIVDMRRMRKVVENGEILVIYPAGLMSDDGRSTPIPSATYGFLKWMDADVYVAKTIGTYFAMPKWRKDGIRSGKTYIDIYKLFDKDELEAMQPSEIEKVAGEALGFDAYEEQEKFKINYKRGSNIEGLENVLYICPSCKKEFTLKNRNKNTIYCESCGFAEQADEYQILHKISDTGEEIRYPSVWNSLIKSHVKQDIESGLFTFLSSDVEIRMICDKKRRFEKVGNGRLTLSASGFVISGNINGEETELKIPISSFAALPYKPGEYIEIQRDDDIYRCLPTDGRIVVKYINMIKIFYEQSCAETDKKRMNV